MVTQQRVADELREARAAFAGYLAGLPEADWDGPTLCEGWSVKDLMSHTIGIQADVAAQRLEGVGTVEQNQRQVDERAAKSPKELLAEWEIEGKNLEEGVEALPDEMWNLEFTQNFTIGQSLQRMVEDLWVHEQDIRIPRGDEPTTGRALISTLEVASRDLENRLPIHAPTVGKVSINAGEFSSVVAGPGTESVDVDGDIVTLGLVSVGRITLADAVKDGKLFVSPNAPAGFAEAINIYGA